MSQSVAFRVVVWAADAEMPARRVLGAGPPRSTPPLFLASAALLI